MLFMKRALVICGFALGSTLVHARHACAQEPERESAAMEANKGFQLSIAPTFLLPVNDSPWGGGASLEARYGVQAGRTVFAPGLRGSAYVVDGRFVGMPMGTVKWTIPVGPLAPFLVGGLGAGFLLNPADSGPALMGGGGMMIHFGRLLGVGAEVTYQTITNTRFHNVALGPTIMIGG